MENEVQKTPTSEAQITPREATQQSTQASGAPKQKSWAVIGLTALVLFFLGTTGFLTYQNFQLRKQVAGIPPTPSSTVGTPTPTATASSPTTVESTPTQEPMTNWKSYTNDRYNFTFKYPSDWEYQENSSKTQNTIDYLQITLAKSEYFNPIPKGNPMILITITETTDKDKLSVYQNTEVVRTMVIGGITAEERKHKTSTIDSKYITFVNNNNTYEVESRMHTQSTEHQETFDQILSTLTFIQ